jgi:hypothetical protein
MEQYRYEPNGHPKSAMDQAAETGQHALEQAADVGQQALDQATQAATVVRDTVKDNPIASLVVVGGLAFAIGALWKMQRTSRTSHVDALMDRLAGLQQQLPKRWRL